MEPLESRQLLSTAVFATAPLQLDPSPAADMHEAEMAVAIDPTNPLHVEAAVSTQITSHFTEYSSMNGGRTWQSQVLPMYCYDAPTVSFDANGNLFIGFEAGGQQVGILGRAAGVAFPSLQYWEYSFESGVDKPSIGIGLDPVHGEQALYLTMREGGDLTGWDITPGINLTPYGTNPDGTMKVVYSNQGGNSPWCAPVVSASGDVYIASWDGQAARLNGGLWAANPTWTKVSWPTPDPPNAFDGTTLYEASVPADPYRGIFNGPELALSPNGEVYMAYAQTDPNYVADTKNPDGTITYSQTPYTHVYVVSCTNPESSSPTWGTPVAVDTDTNVTEFLPALSVDPVTGTVGVLYYTTSGTPDLQTVVARLAYSTGSGAAGTWSNKTISPTLESNMAYHDSMNNRAYFDQGLDYLEFNGLDMRGGVAQAAWASAVNTGSTPGVYAFASRISISDSAYQSTVTSDAPAVYWRLNEPSGTTAFDSSGGANNGTYSSATLNILPIVNHDDTARSISGAVTSNFIYNTSTVSVEAWIELSSAGSSGLVAGFFNGRGSGTYDKDLYIDSSGRVNWYVFDGTPHTITGPVLSTSTKYHVVGTADGTTMRLYVNGVQVASAAAGPTYTGYTVNDFMAGGSSTFGSGVAGLMEEVAAYGYALSPARILAHYNAGLAPYTGFVADSVPAAYWRLDETSGTAAVDSSGNGLTGTYSGAYALGATGALYDSAGTSVSFTGGNVSGAGLPANAAGAPVTVEMWLDPANTNDCTIFMKGAAGTSVGYGLGMWYGQLAVINASGVQGSGTIIPTNQWSYVVAVFTAGGTSIYVNGFHGGNGPAASADSTGVWSIGADTTGAQPFTGLIQEAAVYNYALSADQIRAHYTAGIATYKETITYDSPAMYWRLDDSTGTTAADSAGKSAAGFYSGNYTLSQGGALLTDSDTAAGFNGGSVLSNNYWNFAEVTVETWVYLNAMPSGTGLLAGFGSTVPTTMYDKDLYIDSSGRLNWYVNDGNQENVVGPALTTGQWYYVAGTADGTTMRLYLNGQQVASAAAGPTETGYSMVGNVNVAGGIPAYGSTSGTFDEFAVYNHALSSVQIANHYDAGVSAYASGIMADSPAALWRLAETSGTTAFDASGHGAGGTYGPSVTETGFDAEFGGSGGITGTGLAAIGSNDTYTLEAWINPSTTTGTIFAGGSPWYQTAFGIGLCGSDGNGNAVIMLESQNGTTFTTYSVPIHTTSYIVAEFSPSGTDVYLNGKFYFHDSRTIYANSGGGWSIGAGGTDPLNFSGAIWDVALYNYGLGPSQMSRHYQLGLGYSAPP